MTAIKHRRVTGTLGSLFAMLVRPLPLHLPLSVSLALAAGLLLSGALLAWRMWGPAVLVEKKYLLTAESITIPPQPAWIPGDIRQEVLRDGSLLGLSTLEPELALRVARAFEVHSWVAKVRRVSKHYPDRITVDLEYRRPVAMVEVGKFVYAIDAQSVVLPSQYFLDHPEEVRKFPRIAVGDSAPIGPEGAAWGDLRVAGAARIAALLCELWPQFGLYRITLLESPPPARAFGSPYVLTTRNFARVIWGSPPGREMQGELPASGKITALLAYIGRHGSLENAPSDLLLDLRQAQPFMLPPQRQANAPLP